MPRFRDTSRMAGSRNWAELLLDLGRGLQRRMGQARGREVAVRLCSAPRYFRLAIEFAGASDVLKLRAIVEDWPRERIADELERRTAVASRSCS